MKIGEDTGDWNEPVRWAHRPYRRAVIASWIADEMAGDQETIRTIHQRFGTTPNNIEVGPFTEDWYNTAWVRRIAVTVSLQKTLARVDSLA